MGGPDSRLRFAWQIKAVVSLPSDVPTRHSCFEMLLRWLARESKMLSAAAYDDSKQILYLRFATQATFIATSSSRLPALFRCHIRDHFRYERMAKLHAA